MVIRALLIMLLLAVGSAHAGTVNVPGDYPTIQAAIDAAPDGSTVQVAAGTYQEQLTFAAITRSLVVRGNPDDPASVVVNGAVGPRSTVHVVDTGASVVIEGFTFTGGKGFDGYGGGLFFANSQAVVRHVVLTGNHAPLDGGGAFILSAGGLFEDVTFQNNSAGRFGGGILVLGSNGVPSTTVFDRCRFLDNEAGTDDRGNGWGGGMYVSDSSPTFVGCLIEGNLSRFAAGGVCVLGHRNAAPSLATFRDTLITDNTTEPHDANGEAQGGGMHIESNVVATLERVVVRGNLASAGGGLSNYQARYVITDSVIEDNQGIANPNSGSGGYGGGIWASAVNVPGNLGPSVYVTLVRSVVRRNASTLAAGILIQGDFSGLTTNRGYLELTDSIVAGNQAFESGGGILADRATSAITRSMLLQNRAQGTSGWGGAFMSIGGSDTTILDSTIAGNTVPYIGGGLLIDQGGVLSVDGSRFLGNAATTATPLGGSAIAVTDLVGTGGPATGLVRNSRFVGNGTGHDIYESTCLGGGLSAIAYHDNVFYDGGGIYTRNCDDVANTASAFNALGSGKAQGNSIARTDVLHFLAAPATIIPGTQSTLAWTVANADGITIDGGVGLVADPLGSADVSPPVTSTYTLTTGSGDEASVLVTVACTAIGIPIPRSPSNGNTSQKPSRVTLSWFAATGASAYDVYLDTVDASTPIATDLSTTELVVENLPPSTRHRWRVVAKSPACDSPSVSPVFDFTTCTDDACAFTDDFGDGDASNWTSFGRGSATVVDGALQLATKGRFAVSPPQPARTDVTVALTLHFRAGRRSVRVLFAYQDGKHFRELLITAKGTWKLRERNGRKRKTYASGRQVVDATAPLPVRLVIAGATATAFSGDTTVVTATYPAPVAGTLWVQAQRATIAIDDVVIQAPPAS